MRPLSVPAGVTARARPERAANLRATPVGRTGQTEASPPSPIITCGWITRPERGGSDLFEHPARRYTAHKGAAGVSLNREECPGGTSLSSSLTRYAVRTDWGANEMRRARGIVRVTPVLGVLLF